MKTILSQLTDILPAKTDSMNYNLSVITDAEFNQAYAAAKGAAIKEALTKISRLKKQV
ncbi:MAG: hypothetical protein IJX89_00615 [Alphaproteobacteria bacterium]|nr:hypothetical protein [Alphaproteobacteria bacterium]